MSCRSVRKALPLLAGDDLPPRKAARVRAHLAGCPACRREAVAFAGVRSAARALAAADPSPVWTDAAWSAAVRRAAAEAAPRGRVRRRLLRPVLAYGLAGAVALGGAAAALRWLRPHSQPRPDFPLAAIYGQPAGPVLQAPAGPHLTTITIDPKDGRIRLVWRFSRDLPLDAFGK